MRGIKQLKPPAQGVEVFLSVGGGGSGSDHFPAMAANAAARRSLASASQVS